MYDIVIFGLDGTLLHTLPDLTAAVNAALDHMGYPKRTEEEVEKYMGNGTRRIMERALPPEADMNAAKEAYRFFREYYTSHALMDTKPYDGIINLLKKLKNKNKKMAILSNKNQESVTTLHNAFFSEYISTALGESPEVRKKPDPIAIKKLMKEFGSDKAVYVGDSIIDIQTADNAGIPCILVDWGHGRYLDSLGAMAVVHTPEEILEYI